MKQQTENHIFINYTPICKNKTQEQDSDKIPYLFLSPFKPAPDSKSKTGLERFIQRYGTHWNEMFIGSRK